MSIEALNTIAVWLIVACVPAVNLFPLIYGSRHPWWTTLAGRALLVKSVSTMLLVDLALIVRVVELDPYATAWLRNAILLLIFFGSGMMFLALLREQRRDA